MTKPISVPQYIIRQIKTQRFYLGIFVFVGLTWAILNTVLPFVLKMVIDKAVAFEGNKQAAFHAIQPYIYFYIGLWILFCLDMRLLDWAKMKLLPSLRQSVMGQMFAYLNQHAYRYFQNNFAGSLINKIVDMQGGIVDIVSIIDDVYAQSLGLLMALIMMLIIHPVFAGILSAWVTVFLAITLLYLRPIENLSHVFAQARTTLVGKMVDSISNIVNVRLFAKHEYENQYIHTSIVDTVHKDQIMQAKIIHMRLWWDVTIVVLLGSNLWMLGSMYSRGAITIGDFAFVMNLSLSIVWNLWYIAGQFVSFTEQFGRCRQALAIVNAPHEIVDKPGAMPLIVTHGEIAFHDVSFHYHDSKQLFNNKNIVLHPGQRVGLVGFSGSGKSTFVNLILRLFELESGAIAIDHQSIQNVTQDSLRRHIGLIPQDISLFHRSLMDNIRYGANEARDADVMEAAKQAHCHEFIMQLEEGYQSLVGERGVKLSGGQRQRIAIARAILKNAPILILDEATSALDSVTEQYIQDSLHCLMQGKTTIVIAHRLSTLAAMDRILVFDKGQIIEDGTHMQLLEIDGHYARMWHMQAGGFLPEKDLQS